MLRKNMLFLVIFLFLVGCGKQEVSKADKYTFSFIEFKTDVNIVVYDWHKNKDELNDIIFHVRKIFQSYDSIMNPSLPSSILYNLNLHAQKKSPNFVEIPQKLREIFKKSNKLYSVSKGYFDPAMYYLVEKWGFVAGCTPKVLSDNYISSCLKQSSWNNILLKPDSIAFLNKNIKIGFGAIAKGEVVDSVANFLEKNGVLEFIINAGGDLLVKGSKSKLIGVKNPRNDGMLDTLRVVNQAVATSGDYEKFFIRNNQRYHHLLNPFTGKSDSDICSITVVSSTAQNSDALATTLFVMGYKKAKEYMLKNNIKGVLVQEYQGKINKERINLD